MPFVGQTTPNFDQKFYSLEASRRQNFFCSVLRYVTIRTSRDRQFFNLRVEFGAWSSERY
jgi:hypothetical protein